MTARVDVSQGNAAGMWVAFLIVLTIFVSSIVLMKIRIGNVYGMNSSCLGMLSNVLSLCISFVMMILIVLVQYDTDHLVEIVYAELVNYWMMIIYAFLMIRFVLLDNFNPRRNEHRPVSGSSMSQFMGVREENNTPRIDIVLFNKIEYVWVVLFSIILLLATIHPIVVIAHNDIIADTVPLMSLLVAALIIHIAFLITIMHMCELSISRGIVFTLGILPGLINIGLTSEWYKTLPATGPNDVCTRYITFILYYAGTFGLEALIVYRT